jgi:hypothetical protein
VAVGAWLEWEHLAATSASAMWLRFDEFVDDGHDDPCCRAEASNLCAVRRSLVLLQPRRPYGACRAPYCDLAAILSIRDRVVSGNCRSSAVASLVVGFKIRYRGSPAPVDVLDALLRAEGLRVDHRPVVVSSAGGDNVVAVVLYIADAGEPSGEDQVADVRPMVDTAIGRFKLQFPRTQLEIVNTTAAPPVVLPKP